MSILVVCGNNCLLMINISNNAMTTYNYLILLPYSLDIAFPSLLSLAMSPGTMQGQPASRATLGCNSLHWGNLRMWPDNRLMRPDNRRCNQPGNHLMQLGNQRMLPDNRKRNQRDSKVVNQHILSYQRRTMPPRLAALPHLAPQAIPSLPPRQWQG